MLQSLFKWLLRVLSFFLLDLELIKQNNVLSKPAFFLLLPNHFTTNIKACSFLTLGSLIIPDGPTFHLARPQQTLLGSAALHCSPQTLSWGNTAHLKREHELWERWGCVSAPQKFLFLVSYIWHRELGIPWTWWGRWGSPHPAQQGAVIRINNPTLSGRWGVFKSH